MKPPARFRVVHGELATPGIMAARIDPMAISPARAAHRVVQAAQAFAAVVLASNVLETIDLSTEEGKVFLTFLDAVDEYEYRSIGIPVADTQDPATLF